jgi:hypothetical protein
VFFCKTRSFALRFLLANSHKPLRAAHGNAPSGWEASCHGQLSSGAIEVPFRSHRAVFRIFFNKKIFLDRTGPTSDQSEHIFDNHYKPEFQPYLLYLIQAININTTAGGSSINFVRFSNKKTRVKVS